MTNLWAKIKQIFSVEEKDQENEDIDISYPEVVPMDERFAQKFTEAGGHFLYCSTPQESLIYLKEIIDNEHISRFVCFDDHLQKMLNTLNGNHIDYPSSSADFSFVKCEGLVAYSGAIMLSSDTLGNRKVTELPNNYIVYATTQQIYENLNEVMKVINRVKSSSLPSGITAIGGMDQKQIEQDSVVDKNIFLLIVEE